MAAGGPRGRTLLSLIGGRSVPPDRVVTGALLLRRLLPVAFIGLPVLALLVLTGDHQGWYGLHVAIGLTVGGSAMLVAAFAWAAARELSEVDARRAQAITDLRHLTAELEDRVEQRVAQEEAHSARIAVLEDRERIATELHDVVVQQLFAAGMQLQGLAARSDPATVGRRVDAAVDAIDSAIADLRASIVDLGSGVSETDLHAAARHVVDGASLGLGFRPTLTFEGPVEQATAATDDLMAVLREALSNVARHAHATRTDVRLAVTRDDVVLTVADDGVGIGRVERESGTRHMAARAQQFGGTCRLLAGWPQGTVVEWRVPRGADGRLAAVGPLVAIG